MQRRRELARKLAKPHRKPHPPLRGPPSPKGSVVCFATPYGLCLELADLRAGYVNLQPFALLRAKLESIYHKQQNRPALGTGLIAKSKVFAYGEDTHALRLTSKLADLRARYVNLQPFALLRAKFKLIYHKQQNRPVLGTGLFCWQG